MSGNITSMKNTLAIIAFVLFPLQSFATDSCILKNVFSFGASLSAGYGSMMDVALGSGSNTTPAEVLINDFYFEGEFNNENTKIKGGWYHDDTQRVFSDPQILQEIKSSSSIISMDAFYWDAIDGEAIKTSANTCQQSIDQMLSVVEFSKNNNISLVLANIPSEKGTPVAKLLRLPPTNWREPFDACYKQFNQQLEDVCKPDNNCFIVDINDVVTRLNKTENPGVLWNGQLYTREQLRLGDGVHLSPQGNAYIGGLIYESIMRSKPELIQSCSDH